jgi:hypothetical protein
MTLKANDYIFPCTKSIEMLMPGVFGSMACKTLLAERVQRRDSSFALV